MDGNGENEEKSWNRVCVRVCIREIMERKKEVNCEKKSLLLNAVRVVLPYFQERRRRKRN